MSYLPDSELILNKDGSIYHLNLLPEDLAPTVITVGDPDRVAQVTRHFDTIHLSKQKREFKTETGSYQGRLLSVISTGIGTDNIDIVLNELDALANINFNSRRIKENPTTLNIIRLGTSGAIQESIPVDSILVSEAAIGFDNLMNYYQSEAFLDLDMQQAFTASTHWEPALGTPYVVHAGQKLLKHFEASEFYRGVTATGTGFYAPQGRQLRAQAKTPEFISNLQRFRFEKYRITNLEMKTSAIYGLSALLGHHALSINAILANRATGAFSLQPEETVSKMIKLALDRIVTL